MESEQLTVFGEKKTICKEVWWWKCTDSATCKQHIARVEVEVEERATKEQLRKLQAIINQTYW